MSIYGLATTELLGTETSPIKLTALTKYSASPEILVAVNVSAVLSPIFLARDPKQRSHGIFHIEQL